MGIFSARETVSRAFSMGSIVYWPLAPPWTDVRGGETPALSQPRRSFWNAL